MQRLPPRSRRRRRQGIRKSRRSRTLGSWSRRTCSSRTSRSTECAGCTSDMAIDLARPWTLNEQVALRPEPFGALAYHFGTRRLSFLKTRKLLAVVQALGEHATGRAACTAAGVTDAELP